MQLVATARPFLSEDPPCTLTIIKLLKGIESVVYLDLQPLSKNRLMLNTVVSILSGDRLFFVALKQSVVLAANKPVAGVPEFCSFQLMLV